MLAACYNMIFSKDNKALQNKQQLTSRSVGYGLLSSTYSH